MNKTKTYVWSAVVFGVLFLIGSLMQSRESQAKGAYSTPVTVMNTLQNPGSVLDAERASRTPYRSFATTNQCTGATICQLVFSAAPSGYRLVVENVSGTLHLTPGAKAPFAFMFSNSISFFHGIPGSVGDTVGTTAYGGFNQNVVAYFDPADGAPIVDIAANFSSGDSQSAILSGYIQNCSLYACAPIQK